MKKNNITLKSFVKGTDSHLSNACNLCDKVAQFGGAFVPESLEPAFLDCCEASGVKVQGMDAAESLAGEVLVLYMSSEKLAAADADEFEAIACAGAFASFDNVTVSERIRTEFEKQLQKGGYSYEITDAGVTDDGVVYCYIPADGTDKTDSEVAETTEEVAADVETEEAKDERKPSALSALIAKVSSKARAAANKAKATAETVGIFVVAVLAVGLAFFTVGSIILYVLNPILDVLNPAGWYRVFFVFAFLLTFAVDAAVFVEVNFLALVAKVWPSIFWEENLPKFSAPRSILYMTMKNCL